MTDQVIFTGYGVEVIKRGERFFVRYDSGELVVEVHEAEITYAESRKIEQGEKEAYSVLLATQSRTALPDNRADDQKKIFMRDRVYRIRKNFESGESIFHAGDEVAFIDDSRSPDDDSFVFQFRDLKSGLTKYWRLYRNQPAVDWTEFFQEI